MRVQPKKSIQHEATILIPNPVRDPRDADAAIWSVVALQWITARVKIRADLLCASHYLPLFAL